MASMTEQTCGCGAKFMARTADVDRGWGKSCSKSCAATRTNKKTGNYQRYMGKKNNYKGSGVDKETFQDAVNEHGGIPEFDRHGDYVGSSISFSNETHHQGHWKD